MTTRKELTPEDVKAFIETFEAELLAAPRQKIDLTLTWRKDIPKLAGVYFIFDNDILVYIGQTANLYKRMGEIGRTYNHSFRKKLGRKLQPDAKIKRGKYIYDIELEALLTTYCNDRISVACKPLAFGRLEVESYLIHKHKESLLNSIGKRNAVVRY